MNLDDLLRPKSVGVISLNDKEFTDSGILKRFMKFTNRDSELHHGNDVSGFLSFHPSNPSTSQFGLGQFVVGAQQDVNHTMNSSLTGADPMSDALKNVVTDILRRTVNENKINAQQICQCQRLLVRFAYAPKSFSIFALQSFVIR